MVWCGGTIGVAAGVDEPTSAVQTHPAGLSAHPHCRGKAKWLRKAWMNLLSCSKPERQPSYFLQFESGLD